MGVQVPPLALSRVRRWAWVLLGLALSCARPPEEFLGEIRARWSVAGEHPTPELLSLLTSASQDLVRELDRGKGWPVLHRRVLGALEGAEIGDLPGGGVNRRIQRAGGPALLLVRDGWGWRLDLLLSDGLWPLEEGVEGVYPGFR